MNEWILILTFAVTGQLGEVRDIAPEIVPGFITKASCEVAARTLSESLIRLAGKERSKQGIASNTSKSAPSIWYECIQVRK